MIKGTGGKASWLTVFTKQGTQKKLMPIKSVKL